MQAKYIQPGREIDYTPSEAVDAGDVVVQGNLVGIAKADIAASVQGTLAVSGIFDVDQNAEVITAGSAVYWDADGSSVSGTASAGAATATATGNTFMGFAQALTADDDDYVRIALRSAETAAAEVATATSITADSATLPIAGLEAEQGGSVTVAGGKSTTSANAGGATSLTGGQAGATGAGGAATVAGGLGGSTSGTGGAAALNGGAAASAASNAIGGAASVTGGIGKGTLAGGAVAITGGVGGATGLGGAVAIAGGPGGTTSGNGGAVAITGGAAQNDDDDGGAVAINGGLKNGSGDDGAVTIGTGNTSSVTVGKAGVLTAFAGPAQMRFTEARTATEAGDGDGLITAGSNFVTVTSSNANYQISLPAAQVGDEIEILVTGEACELISAVTAHKVNNVTVGETNELALVENSLYRCKYVAANNWIVTGVDETGVVETPLTPDTL